jgi:hypothetical protein
MNPKLPTTAPPGSRRKLEVLRRRASGFLPLFISGDATDWVRIGEQTAYIPLGGGSEEVLSENYRRYMESLGAG